MPRAGTLRFVNRVLTISIVSLLIVSAIAMVAFRGVSTTVPWGFFFGASNAPQSQTANNSTTGNCSTCTIPTQDVDLVYNLTYLGTALKGGYNIYDYSFNWVRSNETTAWTQLRLLSPNWSAEPDLLASLAGANGALKAAFNTSLSTWPGGWNQSAIPTEGGWYLGYGVPISTGDTLTLWSNHSLAACVLDIVLSGYDQQYPI